MPSEITLDDLQVLISDVLNADRFRDWVKEHDGARQLADYVFGEIYWHKSIGKPNTDTLAKAFLITSWRTIRIIVGTPDGLKSEDVTLPHVPTWHDGKDDGEYWRVNYVITGVPFGHRKDPIFGNYDEITFIEPTFVNGITWSVPGGQFSIHAVGPRRIYPPSVAFVKEGGPVHISFQVTRQNLLTFDHSGIANP